TSHVASPTTCSSAAPPRSMAARARCSAASWPSCCSIFDARDGLDFKLTSEQQLLQDSVRRFVDKAYAFKARSALLRTRQEGSAAHWNTFADNGWLAAALPEEYGGIGGSPIDTALIAQEFGRGLVIEPYLGCAVLAAQTLAAGGSAAQKDRLLPSL